MKHIKKAMIGHIVTIGIAVIANVIGIKIYESIQKPRIVNTTNVIRIIYIQPTKIIETKVVTPIPEPTPAVVEEEFLLSFYSDLADENGPYGPITCNGEPLAAGMVANNVLPQGTVITTSEFGQLTVSDRGGEHFDDRQRLDVFISRNEGESDVEYKSRVMSMGRVTVNGVIN